MVNEKLKTSVGVKAVVIGMLVLILMIPSVWIMTIIDEREAFRVEALSDITSKWGSSQYIAGPVLVIPTTYADTFYNSKPKNVYILPEILDIQGDLQPETRHRGIYDILLYKSELNVRGKFDLNNIQELDLLEKKVIFEKAYLEFGIPDLKGLTNNIKLNWGKKEISAKTGLKANASVSKGLHFLIPLQSDTKEYVFSMNINLNGSEQIRFSPSGKDTKVKITAPWNHPSFCGDFLPQQKSIDDQHFEAQWKIFNLNRNFPHISFGNPIYIEDNFFGVKLFYPVDQYQQTTRSVKYTFLFLSLTFVCFFLIEILSKKQIHPIQYLLIGSGIVLFYLLLLSLTEHMAFSLAYFIACFSMIVLIALYTNSSIGEFKLTMIVSTVLLTLYGFLFINLQLQDYALLVGSLGLLLTLAAVMFFTRKIDWFSALKQKN